MNNATGNAQEKRDSDCAAVNACTNCETTRGYLNTIWINDSAFPVLLCEDCAEEVHRIEAEADRLAALQSSCDRRALLIDRAQTTGELVNLLRAHDMECVICGSTRKTVVSDRLYVNSAAVCCNLEVA
jgi:hypothetical protein